MPDCNESVCPTCATPADIAQIPAPVGPGGQPYPANPATIQTINTPCVTILGGKVSKSGTEWTNPTPRYGNAGVVQALQSKAKSECVDDGKLGLYNADGRCVRESIGHNPRVTRTSRLVVGTKQDSTDGSFDQLTSKNAGTFPLQALHRTWDDAGGQFNNGVSARNLHLSNGPETVTCQLQGKNLSFKQAVLHMEAHGDAYRGKVAGLRPAGLAAPKCFDVATKSVVNGPCADVDVTLPACPRWVEDSNRRHRVGACACTRDSFGPGVYNVLAYVPWTFNDDSPVRTSPARVPGSGTTEAPTGMKATGGGEGYVFAVWPSHEEEVRGGDGKKNPPPQFRSDVPCYNDCDGVQFRRAVCDDKSCEPGALVPTEPLPCKDVVACRSRGGEPVSRIRHEIAMQIPGSMGNGGKLAWDSMNCITRLNDTGNDTANTGALYTRTVVLNPTKLRFNSTEQESSDRKDYHWYTIHWHVDPTDYTKSYVAFYFDDPFDPTGKTTVNGTALPTQPSGQALHQTQRFVPVRSGRLNFGPWFGWWGYRNETGVLRPSFDTAVVRTAHVSIIPQAGLMPTDFPQSRDQPGATCGREDLYWTPPSDAAPKHQQARWYIDLYHKIPKFWIYVCIGVVAALFIACVVTFLWRLKK